MSTSNPKVCVGVSTFNQARYIRQALDSVLSQRADFDFDVVVHDDASTDGTREIVESYVAAHPSRVRAILQEENQYSQGRRVMLVLIARMQGEYFALLDGDDFWSDPQKLQAQADFLDAHSSSALCQTLTAYHSERLGRNISVFPPLHRRRERLECTDLAYGNFVQTSAVMFRAAALPEFPTTIHALKFGDYPLYALLAQWGWIGTIPQVMATYRIHGNNMWATRPIPARIEATREVVRFLSEHLRDDLRVPFAEAAAAPLASLRPPLPELALATWGHLTTRLRLALGLEPR